MFVTTLNFWPSSQRMGRVIFCGGYISQTRFFSWPLEALAFADAGFFLALVAMMS